VGPFASLTPVGGLLDRAAFRDEGTASGAAGSLDCLSRRLRSGKLRGKLNEKPQATGPPGVASGHRLTPVAPARCLLPDRAVPSGHRNLRCWPFCRRPARFRGRIRPVGRGCGLTKKGSRSLASSARSYCVWAWRPAVRSGGGRRHRENPVVEVRRRTAALSTWYSAVNQSVAASTDSTPSTVTSASEGISSIASRSVLACVLRAAAPAGEMRDIHSECMSSISPGVCGPFTVSAPALVGGCLLIDRGGRDALAAP